MRGSIAGYLIEQKEDLGAEQTVTVGWGRNDRKRRDKIPGGSWETGGIFRTHLVASAKQEIEQYQ